MSRVKRNPCTTSFGANTTFWQHKARDYVTQLRNMYHSLSNACKAYWCLDYTVLWPSRVHDGVNVQVGKSEAGIDDQVRGYGELEHHELARRIQLYLAC